MEHRRTLQPRHLAAACRDVYVGLVFQLPSAVPVQAVQTPLQRCDFGDGCFFFRPSAPAAEAFQYGVEFYPVFHHVLFVLGFGYQLFVLSGWVEVGVRLLGLLFRLAAVQLPGVEHRPYRPRAERLALSRGLHDVLEPPPLGEHPQDGAAGRVVKVEGGVRNDIEQPPVVEDAVDSVVGDFETVCHSLDAHLLVVAEDEIPLEGRHRRVAHNVVSCVCWSLKMCCFGYRCHMR